MLIIDVKTESEKLRMTFSVLPLSVTLIPPLCSRAETVLKERCEKLDWF